MSAKDLMAIEAKTLTLKTLQSLRTVTLASVGQDGWPDVRTMMFCPRQGLDTIHFVTSLEMKKNVRIVIDPKAVVYGYHPTTWEEFRLFGKAELIGDTETKLKIWCDELDDYFPEGAYAHNLIVIRFQTDHGEYASPDKGKGTFTID